MGGGQKFLTMPGGYLVWSATWPATEREGSITDALNGYLTNDAALSR
jgi:hypothetical protein